MHFKLPLPILNWFNANPMEVIDIKKYFEKVKNIIGSNNEERNPYCVFETIIELSPFQKRH